MAGREQATARLEERARQVRDIDERIVQQDARLKERAAEVDAARRDASQLEDQIRELEEKVAQRRRARLAAAWARAADAVQRLEDEEEHIRRWRVEADQKAGRARTITEDVAALRLPSSDELARLRRLHREFEVADAALAVGLSVRVTPHGTLAVAVVSDGMTTQRVLSGEQVFEARTELALRLPGVNVHVAGGTEDARSTANVLRGRWQSEGEPVLARAKIGDLDELESRIREATQRTQEAQTAGHEAAQLAARVEGAGDVASELADARDELRRAEAALDAVLTEGMRREEARAWVESDTAESAAEVEASRSEKSSRLGSLRQSIAAWEALLETGTADSRALERQRDEASADPSFAWTTAFEKVAAERREIAELRAKAERAITDVDAQAGTQAEEAGRVEASEQALDAASTSVRSAAAERDQARQHVAKLEATLELRRGAVAAEDMAAAQAVAEQAQKILAALPVPTQTITESEIADAEEMEHTHRNRLRNEEDELRKLEGGLEHVGGDYIATRMRDAEEALDAVLESERDTELDYGAWKLLEDTVKAAEEETAIHLGKALVEPIEKRMAVLTGGRYGAPAIGPQLGTEGIALSGAPRPLHQLSVGTREQFATLLRLTIAEALRTVLILDDQLVQSDAARMRSLVRMMVASSSSVQIIVLTCRPDDYKIDVADAVTVTDLKAHVERSDGVDT